ncbi:ABC transporter permease [Halobellus salinus]|uniref:ABC transporter permease n=1 Tax=Halobellus salinus TaxID=931585 RepID=A0A830EWH6_9EURY|nr:ABC transporter permease [Halobellus salinus]GGJ17402.1 ABC transporter permease [Halobellus salinus]SMP27578.1 putative spermidine/putrescine transport system permease protein [Halobellus salinus]
MSLLRRFGGDHPYLTAFTIFELAFLILPSVIILVVSLGSGEIISFPPTALSLKWYASLLAQPQYVQPFLNSVIVATFCTAISIPIGIVTALGLNRYDIRFEDGIQIYLLLPFTVPLVVSGFIFLIIFGRLGWIGHLWAVGLGLTIINIPFMIWSVASSVNAFDPTLEDAARSLGAEEIQTFLKVTLPSLMPGVISGALLMFMLALNEFIVSLIITVTDTETLPVAIYGAIRGNISPQIAAVSSVYVLVAIVAIVVADRLVGLERFLHT